jgi:hypothetical protein
VSKYAKQTSKTPNKVVRKKSVSNKSYSPIKKSPSVVSVAKNKEYETTQSKANA